MRESIAKLGTPVRFDVCCQSQSNLLKKKTSLQPFFFFGSQTTKTNKQTNQPTNKQRRRSRLTSSACPFAANPVCQGDEARENYCSNNNNNSNNSNEDDVDEKEQKKTESKRKEASRYRWWFVIELVNVWPGRLKWPRFLPQTHRRRNKK